MSLADGEYIEVRDHITAALQADTGEGGLCEPADPAVKLIEAELRSEPRLYMDHEIPAIAVTILSKEERASSGASVRVFRVGLFVYCRGLDSEVEIQRAMRIAARVERVLRSENNPDRLLGDLPASIEGSLGTLIVSPRRAEFLMGDEARRGQPRYSVVAALEAEIELPCSVY